MSLINEIRHAVRVLVRHRGVTMVALITLALAIGANTAIFTVINSLLLRPLPYPRQEQLVQLGRGFPDGFSDSVSVPKFMYWSEHGGRVLSSVAAYESLGSGFNLVDAGPPDRVIGSRVSRAFFETIGVAPALGRTFTADEDRPGAAKTVVLGHALWVKRFSASPAIVGRAITLNSEPYTVVGVMPEAFRYPDRAELWTPFGFDRSDRTQANYFEVIGRLEGGVTLDQARAAMQTVHADFARANRDLVNPRESIAVRPLRERLYGDMRPALLVLLGAVGFVLLIACVNVANLQLAQIASRQSEIALRTTLGASPWTIVRQLLIESLLLALASGAAGIVLAYWLVPALLALSPADVPGADRIHLDPVVLAFAVLVSLAAGVAFGLLPAWHVARTNLDEVLREGAHRTTGGRSSARMRRLLVASEVALALVLTVGASLLVKSFAGLRRTDPGFAVEHVTTMKLSLPEAKYGKGAPLARFQEDLEARISAIPGVRSAALALSLPLELGPDLPFTIEGQYVAGSNKGIGDAFYRSVGPSYFDALRIPVKEGRRFDARDRRGGVPVAMINQAAARRFWPQRPALGQRIMLGRPFVPELADSQAREIIGIVGDVREEGLGREPPPILYIPLAQQNDAITTLGVRLIPMSLVVRADARTGLLGQVQQAVWGVDPEQPITDVRTMQDVVSRSLGSQRFNTVLLGALAGLALLLAAVGLYGVLSHLVGQQTREIGVRMALGATERNVVGLVLRQGLALVAIGILCGLAGAAGLSRVLRSMLEGVGVLDPWVFAAAPALMVSVAFVAMARPALRAARVDPVRALRNE
jgi:predicted permease